MARGALDRRVSAVPASAATSRPQPRFPTPRSPFSLFPGLCRKLIILSFIALLTWVYLTTRPPPPKICGTPDGPPVTAPRIKLSDGRHLAYKEHGVPRHKARFKFVSAHGFGSNRHSPVVADLLSAETVGRYGIYIVSFDRPGYGESDPDPYRTLKSMASDVEELADHLELGQKFYLIGFSMGGQAVWPCLKYIPHRLAGVTLLAPVVNYWWSGLPAHLTARLFYKQRQQDIWSQRVAHYAPWLTYWWNTQKMFPPSSAIAHLPEVLSRRDKELLAGLNQGKSAVTIMGAQPSSSIQQGVFESLHRDMIIAFGKWEFDPTQLKNPFPNNEGSVHLWQGDRDHLVPVKLQRAIVEKVPWIKYHEVPGAGHMFPFAKGMSDTIIKTQLK